MGHFVGYPIDSIGPSPTYMGIIELPLGITYVFSKKSSSVKVVLLES